MLCKKALANLADVTLAANNCTETLTDGNRVKEVLVRDSTAIRRRAEGSQLGTVGRAASGSAATETAPTVNSAATYSAPTPVACWPFYPVRQNCRRKTLSTVRKLGLRSLQRRSDAYTVERRARAGFRQMPVGYLANVLDRILTRIRERLQHESLL